MKLIKHALDVILALFLIDKILQILYKITFLKVNTKILLIKSIESKHIVREVNKTRGKATLSNNNK